MGPFPPSFGNGGNRLELMAVKGKPLQRDDQIAVVHFTLVERGERRLDINANGLGILSLRRGTGAFGYGGRIHDSNKHRGMFVIDAWRRHEAEDRVKRPRRYADLLFAFASRRLFCSLAMFHMACDDFNEFTQPE